MDVMREIYLDNSATTRPYDEVVDYMNEINRFMYGNPSSLHTKGMEAEKLVKKAREVIADSLKVDSKEIYFTSGGTESNNLAIRGYLEANPRKGKHIITTQIEHPSVLEVYRYLEKQGYTVDFIGVDRNGVIHLDELKAKINKETSLISVVWVNNETGVIQPLSEIVQMKNAINRHAALHVDAIQAYGKFMIAPKKTGIDMLTISSHKIHGPKGVGALYVDSSVRIRPILFGGGQESLLRSGTENVPGIGGFGKAAEMAAEKLDENRMKVQRLKSTLTEGLNKICSNCKVISSDYSSPYILSVAFREIKAEVLLHHLEQKKIFVSSGSACSSRKNSHSHVLAAMGLEACYIGGAIRFSFSAQNNEEEIRATIEAVKEILPRIQRKRA